MCQSIDFTIQPGVQCPQKGAVNMFSEISTSDHTTENHDYFLAELEKAEREAADPNTRWLTHEEIMTNIAKRREARNHV